ncbi:MAG: hypothetical protein E2O68_08305 [Deltaproteobacteria bacterium]|nr:MAG: hypothetical protein E2O68_08305 [Deltaproteobacteria bacterium]
MIKFLLIFFIPLILLAEEAPNIYEDLFLGEQDFSEYFGPSDPLLIRHKGGFVDDFINANYLENNTNPQLFSLINYIADDLSKDIRCPNYQLEKNLDYIRYLNRLISISYLFESLKELYVDSYNLGFGKFCSLEWDKTFGHCRAKNVDMANFIKRIEGKHLRDFSKLRLKRMKQAEREAWIEKFRLKKNHLSVSEARIQLFCQENGINCKTIDYDSLKFAFQLSCAQDQYQLINICSGFDHLYGLSNVKTAFELLVSSEGFKNINQEGFGKECLKRFSRLFKDKESPSKVLATIFPQVKKLMKEDKRVYLQGSLFISGSFKQFDAKGLDGFLFPKDQGKTQELAEREKELSKNLAKIKVPEAPPVEKSFQLKDPSSQDLNKLALGVRAQSQSINSKKKAEPQFKKMEMKRFLIGADKVPLDMREFKRDFTITSNLDGETVQKLKAYAEWEILYQLKTGEGLGTRENPFSLLYLTYLLKHDTGLDNLEKLYKGRFYVLNDLIGPRKISYIELKKLDLGWQIYILKQKDKPSKRPKFKTK